MLSKRATAFAQNDLDPNRGRVAVVDESIEKQKMFFESMLAKRKVEQMKATGNSVSFEEHRERAKLKHKDKPFLGKRNFAELEASMPLSEL